MIYKMEKIKIYYFENKDNLNSADGLDFNQNIDDCINYILTILKKDFNFTVFTKQMIYITRIKELIGSKNVNSFIKDKEFTFPNNVTMYRILKNDTLNHSVDVVFLYITTPDDIHKIINKVRKNFIYIYAPYTYKELNEMKNNTKYELIKLKI